jgi:hypothetical protein
MRLQPNLICSALISLLLATGAHAQEATTTVGEWTIVRASQDNSLQPVCTVLAARDDKVATFALDNAVPGPGSSAHGSARLIFIMPDHVSDSTSAVFQDVTIRTSSGKTWAGLRANWAKKNSGGGINAVVDEEITRVLKPLSVARSLEIVIPQQGANPKVYKVSLAGSSKALEEYLHCLQS